MKNKTSPSKSKRGLLLLLAGLFCIWSASSLTACQKEPPVIAAVQKASHEQWNQVDGALQDVSEADHQDYERWGLPSRWDNRLIGRTASIKNQGDLGTCWAFAALGGLEVAWLPEHLESFSVDHMVMNHGYQTEVTDGGNFSMALAYLAGWRGPVWEVDDPYADGATNPQAPVRAHLQEAQLLTNDRYAIKQAILQNGAVQSSMYADEGILQLSESTAYYQADECAYYYNGEVQYNHDVLLVGWDDTYSRSHFAQLPKGDGAFICQNSWGEEFGETGYFYVSYYDTAIAQNTITYSRLDPPDNYDQIYQNDELGWTGQMGYEAETAWGANLFTAQQAESLAAVSFYATGELSRYEIYVDLSPDTASFTGRQLVAEGSLRHAGYYTIDLAKAVALDAGQAFAVILCITTPEAKMPLAAEYDQGSSETGGGTSGIQVQPGQSYISSSGDSWQDAGEQLSCNVCLKAFTNLR